MARRAITIADFRRIALSMGGAVDGSHMGHADFRVGGKIFATVPKPGERIAMVKLTPAQQAQFTDAEPGAFEPVAGAWGRRGCTYVHLRVVTRAALRRAVFAAWCGAAPKKLIDELGPRDEE